MLTAWPCCKGLGVSFPNCALYVEILMAFSLLIHQYIEEVADFTNILLWLMTKWQVFVSAATTATTPTLTVQWILAVGCSMVKAKGSHLTSYGFNSSKFRMQNLLPVISQCLHAVDDQYWAVIRSGTK